MDNTFLVPTEEEMINLGKKIGQEIVNSQSCLSISGELGAGKTTLVKGIISSLGVEDVVTSPSYNIVRQYSVGELSIFHADCYRLNSFQEFLDLDLPIGQEGNVILIEWGNLLPKEEWRESTNIQIDQDDGHTRKVTVAL